MSGTYLLEIGTEELPAFHISEAQRRLKDLFSEKLENAGLCHEEIDTFATPRRLAVMVSGLPAKQPTVEKKVRGPKYEAGFDVNGEPKKPAIGFARKNNIDVSELKKEVIGDTPYIVANLTIEGKETGELLANFMPEIISHVSGERLMRWGSSEIKFSRPIRWIVSLLDEEIVEFSFGETKAGRKSLGHRILAPDVISLKNPLEYVAKLKESKVLVNQLDRKKIIVDEVENLAKEVSGAPGRINTSLLEEVVNITEWPRAIRGSFSSDYLELPQDLLETIMVHHQRYFPVQKEGTGDKDKSVNNLLPYFITISNNDQDGAHDSIRQGNERVLRARLADGKFFYFDDQKKKLDDRVPELRELTYQHGLGNYLDKRERLVKLADKLTDQLKLDTSKKENLATTMLLCKLDLVTNLVGELPELQGFVGSWYAREEHQPDEVVKAIASHYAPRYTDDQIPQDLIGCFASIIDKIDHLTGLFALGKKPTGSSDPFALRRNAQGLVDILLSPAMAEYPVNIEALIDYLLDDFEPMLKDRKKGFDRKKIKSELEEFILQRLRGSLMDEGFVREVVEAVLTANKPLTCVRLTKLRCRVIEKLLASKEGCSLIRAGVRISNILKGNSCQTVIDENFSKDEEKELWQTYQTKVLSLDTFKALSDPQAEEQFEQLGEHLMVLVDKIDGFFENVMVNDEDEKKRDLRHAILFNIDQHFKKIGEFKKLQPLLP